MRIATAGIGLRAGHILRIFCETMPEAQIVGYFDPQPTYLHMIGDSTPAYSSITSLLDGSKPDILFVFSPNHFHLDQIEAGLRAGVRVFSEKPVVTSIEDTMRLAKLLAEFGADRVMVGLVLRYSQHMVDLRKVIADGQLGDIVSLEGNEHICPSHGAFFMRDWRRKVEFSGGFMLEKCCHDIDIYNMITSSRPKRVASFGGRSSFQPKNAPNTNIENEIFHVKKSIWNAIDDPFKSDGDIVDYQTAILEYESGPSLAFHTNINTPDEHRRFCVMGTHGMAEGDFVRGYLKVTRRNGNVVLNKDYNQVDKIHLSAHYGADHMMVKDIADFLRGEVASLPVGIVDAMQAGLAAMALDEARNDSKIIDLSSTWALLDNYGIKTV